MATKPKTEAGPMDSGAQGLMARKQAAAGVPAYAGGTGMRSVPGTGIKFRPGGLHASLGVPQGPTIPPAKMAAAAAGKDGAKAQRQADLAKTLEGMRKSGARPKAVRNAMSRAGGKR